MTKAEANLVAAKTAAKSATKEVKKAAGFLAAAEKGVGNTEFAQRRVERAQIAFDKAKANVEACLAVVEAERVVSHKRQREFERAMKQRVA